MGVLYDPSDGDTRRNPYPLFARLRDEDPVHWSPQLSGWVITRYDLATQVLMESDVYSADRIAPFHRRMVEPARSIAADIIRWLRLWLVFRDRPDHSRIRRHLVKALNLPAIEKLRPGVSSIVSLLLDRIGPGTAFDFVSEFATPMPGMVIMDLVGAPRERFVDVKQWSDDMMLFIGSSRQTNDKYERARRGALSMAQLFRDLIAERREDPRDDLVTRLLASRIDGAELGEEELIGTLMAVLNGGHETTVHLLTNSLMALTLHPEVGRDLRRDPAKIPDAVEELLRYDGPVLSTGRLVMQDADLAGKRLAAGDRVFVMLVAANRDPAVFAEPDRIDVARTPNPHIAFGKGPHFCAGAPLSRLEAQIALSAILERYRSIEVMEPLDGIHWTNSMVTRGPERLPVRLH